MKPSNLIKEFLLLKRFAMVGVSRDPRDFSRRLYVELLRRGYDVIPVNPGASEIEGRHCFARVQDITPPVSSALLITSRPTTHQVLQDCADAGVTLAWIFGTSGIQDINPESVKFCEEHGIAVVPGYCPYMFMPMTALFHRVHGFVCRVLGKYPV